LFNGVIGKCCNVSVTPSVICVETGDVWNPIRLSSEVGSHAIMLEEESQVSEGARDKLRCQPDVSDVLFNAVGIRNTVDREVAGPHLEQDLVVRDLLDLVVPGNFISFRINLSSVRPEVRKLWVGDESEVEWEYEISDIVTLSVEATELGEA
jgi:hypothetical protein